MRLTADAREGFAHLPDVIMQPGLELGWRRRPHNVRSWRVGALVALVLALLAASDLPVVHDHEAPGLYNEECPLARLATTSPQVSASPSPGLFLPARAPEAVPPAPRAVLAPFSPAPFDPRA